MTTSVHRVVSETNSLGRLYWLPGNGWGNGLDDDSWAAILDLRTAYVASLLLFELADATVPAYAAPVRRSAFRPADGRRPMPSPIRIWVGGSRYGVAQSVLLRVLPRMIGRYGEIVA